MDNLYAASMMAEQERKFKQELMTKINELSAKVDALLEAQKKTKQPKE